jgi:hypothetical protein
MFLRTANRCAAARSGAGLVLGRPLYRRALSSSTSPHASSNQFAVASASVRQKSSSAAHEEVSDASSSPLSTSNTRNYRYSFNKDGDVVVHKPPRISEVLNFPASSTNHDPDSTQPVLLNAKEHVVGYLSRILNARVYDVCIETELQHAKNLSAVSFVVP